MEQYIIFDIDTCSADGAYTGLESTKEMLKSRKKEYPFCVIIKSDNEIKDMINIFGNWMYKKSRHIPKHLKNKMRFMAFERAVG